MSKKRIDQLLVEKKLTESRNKALRLILAKKVRVSGRFVTKPSELVSEEAEISIETGPKYVGRGAEKLERAVSAFEISFSGKIVADIGASTGGFTDLILRNGAKKVYAIDVGYGQLDYKLRQNPKVVNMERTNIRDVEKLPEKIDIFTVDVSFISLKQVLPQLRKINTNLNVIPSEVEESLRESLHTSNLNYRKGSLRSGRDDKSKAELIALFKPQFEVGKKVADKYKGVIKDEEERKGALNEFKEWLSENNFKLKGETESPIKGAKGNKEYFLWIENSLT